MCEGFSSTDEKNDKSWHNIQEDINTDTVINNTVINTCELK